MWVTTGCCYLETGADGCDLVPVSLDRMQLPSQMPQIRRHWDYAGTCWAREPQNHLRKRGSVARGGVGVLKCT